MKSRFKAKEMTMAEKRISLFSNGTQFMDWQGSNCCRCKKSVEVWGSPDDWPTCPIEEAILLASIDDGTLSPEMAARAGYSDETKLSYVWPCTEVEWTEEWKAEYLRRQQEPTP